MFPHPVFVLQPASHPKRDSPGSNSLSSLVILAILAGVAIGPISAHMEQARINRAVESAHTINTLLSQYALDNNGVYPAGEGTSAAGKSEGIARNLLENKYTPDATIFAVGSTAAYSGKASDFSDISAANISWDFTGGATASTGITSAVPDLLPTVYSTGENVAYPATAGTGYEPASIRQRSFWKDRHRGGLQGQQRGFHPRNTLRNNGGMPGVHLDGIQGHGGVFADQALISRGTSESSARSRPFSTGRRGRVSCVRLDLPPAVLKLVEFRRPGLQIIVHRGDLFRAF